MTSRIRKSCQDMKDQLPARGRRIDALRQGQETDAATPQFLDHGNQVPDRPAQTIQPPDDEHIAFPKRLHHGGQTASRILGSGNTMILKDLRTAGIQQGISLQIQVLVRRRHSRISNPRHESFQIHPASPDCLDRTERIRGTGGRGCRKCVIGNIHRHLRMEQKNSLRRDKTVRFCHFMLIVLPPDSDDEAAGNLQADFSASHGFVDFQS
ncbi:hypothetical protein Ddc_22013 [Ditylenchus destructor]|nr:hypothetical protein Ddc_22013 [Ditylenchus destructor]